MNERVERVRREAALLLGCDIYADRKRTARILMHVAQGDAWAAKMVWIGWLL